ncbi:hypothetical protein EF294_10920 [Gordonia oryzae]|uniref:Uncharacterized protein n=1 Tax=Gordonia oryzae TaxID=2487349 RepID=A0A3N4GEC1_9ACTN|nr:hypothetical protein [Gordonia oryzae]RPA61139.1 hypothetical protein EF294_10920 [Gordonia oryzae]
MSQQSTSGQPTSGPHAFPALTEMSVNDMIAATPLGPILDRPVGDVLAGLGLPPLPEFPPLPPLPGLPPLPAIDVGLLVKPITDLLGSFGTGDLSAADFDPTVIFQGLSTMLESSMSMAQAAMKIADEVWGGQSAVSAAAKTGEASVNSGQLAAQGSGMSFDIEAAAGIVAAGIATLQAILAATIAKITAAVSLTGPAALPLAVSLAGLGLSEATAAVAATRAQLLAPTTHMAVNGAPVPVTNAPTRAGGATQSPFALAGAILDAVSPVVSTATEIPSLLTAPLQQALAADDTAVRPAAYVAPEDGAGGPAGPGGRLAGLGAMPMGAGGAGRGGSGAGGTAITAPLGAARSGMTVVGATEPASYAPASPARVATGTATPMPASMAPMAAAGAARGAGASDDTHEVPDYLVTENNGKQMVGGVADVAPAVLGADADPETAPDIELRLGPAGPVSAR